jgi:DNA excision repair protein ERCC-4
MQISIDYREQASGIIDLLKHADIRILVQRLQCGDYLINNSTCVERKTARDFIISIIDGRLFDQIARLKKTDINALLLIEGDPFATNIKIDKNAVQGALISITALWNVPIVFSSSPVETTAILLTIGRQWENARKIPLRKRRKFRKKKSKRLFFLQGLRVIGPAKAERLLRRFGSVIKILTAGEDDLRQVKGIGKSIVSEIKAMLYTEE